MQTWRNWREVQDIREYTSDAIQSQYSASTKILALAQQFQQHVSPHEDAELFYKKNL